MAELQEGRYAGEFIVSEGNGSISRETITVLSGETLQAGAVLGKVTASGKYKALDPAAVNSAPSIRPSSRMVSIFSRLWE
jgi:Bacteriophage lambda head decoration protein D